MLFLDTAIFAVGFGWRLSFAVGAILGLGILLVRRRVPESPRWLFIHGREQEAEGIVNSIEQQVQAETRQPLSEPGESITVRQRTAIPFRELAKVACKYYPTRAALGLALFIGQAFLYNAVTFDLGTILGTYFNVSSGAVPYFTIIFAAGNFLGALLLSRLFDTVGRKPMITGTYLGSAALTVLLGVLLIGGGLNQWSFIALVGATFFFASAGASSAYLTVSEIFPMETRALAIAFFYAVGTGIGGIIGPLLFGNFIASGSSTLLAVGFFIGAAAMAAGGVAEIAFGVRAERVSLENIAKPLTAADAEQAQTAPEPAAAEGVQAGAEPEPELTGDGLAALETSQLPEERVRSAKPRAASPDSLREEETERERQARMRDARIGERAARIQSRERQGLRRFRPGPGTTLYSPGMVGTASRWAPTAEQDLDREIEVIRRALEEHGPMERDKLAEYVGARYWGPGRIGPALREAVEDGSVRRLGRNMYALSEPGEEQPQEHERGSRVA